MGNDKKKNKQNSQNGQSEQNVSSIDKGMSKVPTPPTPVMQPPPTQSLINQSHEILYGSQISPPYVHEKYPTPPQHPDYYQSPFRMYPGQQYQQMTQCGSQPNDTLQIASLLENLDKRLKGIELHLSNQNSKIEKIEQHVEQIEGIKHNLNTVQVQVKTIERDMGEFKTKMADYDTSIQCFSDMCDEILQSNQSTNDKLSTVNKTQQEQMDEIRRLRDDNTMMKDRLTDLQWRSMRENLIFTGIEEPRLQPNEFENTENTLQTFLESDMKFTENIEFERVHRLGRYMPNQRYPRPIIAKFTSYKMREKVRWSAPDALRGTRFGVREQFPPEIEEKRKLLYPVMRQAKQNKQNKVRLIRDKLYINGQEYRETRQQPDTRQTYDRYNTQRTWGNYDRTTTTRRGDIGQLPQANNTLFTQNRFNCLTDGATNSPTRYSAGKQKATSPLEALQTNKKLKEATETSYTDLPDETTTNPTTNTQNNSQQTQEHEHNGTLCGEGSPTNQNPASA